MRLLSLIPARGQAARTQAVQRLLEFSQNIQGAGKPEQIFQALAFYLRGELELAGIVIVAQESDSHPGIQFKAHWPDDLLIGGETTAAAAELDTNLCPCLRQN